MPTQHKGGNCNGYSPPLALSPSFIPCGGRRTGSHAGPLEGAEGPPPRTNGPGGGPVTPDPPPRELLSPLSAAERRRLNHWYEVTGDYAQENPPLPDILDWTAAEVREAVLTHTVRAHPPPSPLGDRGYTTYAIWGPLHTSIVSAILCSLPPRDSTVTVRHFLAASAAWLSHIWFSQDPTYRQIAAGLQRTYRDSEHGNPDPWPILRVPFTLACYPEALLIAWADLTCRPASILDVFPDPPTSPRTPGPPALGGYWVTRVHEDIMGEYMAGMGRQAAPCGRGAGAHPRGPAAPPPPDHLLPQVGDTLPR